MLILMSLSCFWIYIYLYISNNEEDAPSSHYSFSGKSMCVCGAQHVFGDDMLPNNTVRDAINRILEANNSGGDNKGSAFHIQGLQSFLHLQCI